MDKTIKSLKGSSEYREQSELLIERFYSLLTPYKSLMEKWINQLPPTTFKETDQMLMFINKCFQDLSNNKATRQLNPSGRISIPAITIDNFSLYEISRKGVSSDITLEDLFSLIHQNILIATTILGKDSQIKPKQLPASLNALHAELSEKVYKNNGPNTQGATTAALMSTTLAYPIIHLDYNLPLRNHSAKFFLDYNQETGEIIFNAKFFGHNNSNRMDKIAQLVQIEGEFIDAKTIRVSRYNDKSQLLEWAWVFNKMELQGVLKSVHEMIQNCCDMTYYEYRDTPEKSMEQMMSRHEDFKLAPPLNIPKALESIILGAELEGALLNVQMISSPHFNDKTKEVNWCWRLTNTENIAELSKTLIKSFNGYAYYDNSFNVLLKSYSREATSPARQEQIIQCVKDFSCARKTYSLRH